MKPGPGPRRSRRQRYPFRRPELNARVVEVDRVARDGRDAEILDQNARGVAGDQVAGDARGAAINIDSDPAVSDDVARVVEVRGLR